MTRMHPITLAAVAVFASAAGLQGQESWTAEGLQDLGIYSLAVGPTGTRYAGTSGGIFRSSEPGVWTLFPGSPAGVTTIAPHPSDPDTLYTGSYLYWGWGFHKTTDGGQHFERLGTSPVGVRSIAIDPANPAMVYVGGDHPKVYRSADAGATFAAPVNEGLVSRIAALVVDPTHPGTVYAGSDQGFEYSTSDDNEYLPPQAPVMRTLDSGVRWFSVFDQFDHALLPVYVTALAIDPRSGTLYAGAREDPRGPTIFRTSDAGIHWDRFVLGSASAVGEIRALVVDPSRTSTIYAATTAAGVLRSEDGGSTWVELNEGLPSLRVGSLVLDSANGELLASDGQQVFRMPIEQRPSACTRTRDRLCLLGDRYKVVVNATNPRTGFGSPGVAIPGGGRFGAFSLPGLTGDSSLPEVLVKMVDATPGPPVQVFYGGLTSVAYSVIVTDTQSGETEVYRNDTGSRLCGGVDTLAFYEPGSEPGDPCYGCWDYVLSKDASRPEQNRALALLGNRFMVTVSAFSARQGRTERGVAVAATDRYGYFSLPGFTGSSTFPEVYVKMVDFRELTGDFRLFHTGLTSLDYMLTVTDQVTGVVRTLQSSGDYCGAIETLAGD